MFTRFARSIALTAVLACGIGAATSAPAFAGGGFGVTIDDRGIEVWDGGRDRYDDGYDRYDQYERRDAYHCSDYDAVDRARELGIRHAQVVKASRRSITVAGRSRGDRTVVTFSRDRGCPVLRIHG